MKNLNILIEDDTYRVLSRLQAKQELETGERPTQSQVISEALAVYSGVLKSGGLVESKPVEKQKKVVAPVEVRGELPKGEAMKEWVKREEDKAAELEAKKKVAQAVAPVKPASEMEDKPNFFRGSDLKNAGVKP